VVVSLNTINPSLNTGMCVVGTIFVLKTVVNNIQSRIRYATCFGLSSHDQALIKNIKKTLNTAIGARSLLLDVIKHYNCTQNFFNKGFLTQVALIYMYTYIYMCVCVCV
jgi:hypothetical protein